MLNFENLHPCELTSIALHTHVIAVFAVGVVLYLTFICDGLRHLRQAVGLLVGGALDPPGTGAYSRQERAETIGRISGPARYSFGVFSLLKVLFHVPFILLVGVLLSAGYLRTTSYQRDRVECYENLKTRELTQRQYAESLLRIDLQGVYSGWLIEDDDKHVYVTLKLCNDLESGTVKYTIRHTIQSIGGVLETDMRGRVRLGNEWFSLVVSKQGLVSLHSESGARIYRRSTDGCE